MVPTMVFMIAIPAVYFMVMNRRNETEAHMMLDIFPLMLFVMAVFIRCAIIGIRYGTITNKEYDVYYEKIMTPEEVSNTLVVKQWLQVTPDALMDEIDKSLTRNTIVE